jgi:isopentenyl phosphate kinase
VDIEDGAEVAPYSSTKRIMMSYRLPNTSLVTMFFIAYLCSLDVQFSLATSQDDSSPLSLESMDVVLIKVGGSSITKKAIKETIDEGALEWFAKILVSVVSTAYRPPGQHPVEQRDACRRTSFVVVHGAGSFGHHHAKEFGIKGQLNSPIPGLKSHEDDRRHAMQGLAQTRLSVQTLNRLVVQALLTEGLNAVGISPCFAIPSMQAHGGDESAVVDLETVVNSALSAGLIPVLHGDACLYGEQGVGILSGDKLMELLGQYSWVSRVIFLTDVDGVFTRDPRVDPIAQLLMTIEVDPESGETTSVDLEASGSTHAHDVTGGLKTKLASAAAIAMRGKNVTIVKCSSASAEKAIRNEKDVERATVLFHGNNSAY